MSEVSLSQQELIEHLRRELEKERGARREAQAVIDAVLQATSEDLHQKNRDLSRLNGEIDARVRARTADLAHAMSRAERSDAAKSEFLARVSHEIRTPMNGVLGLLEVVRAGKLEPEQARYLRMAHESARSLLRMIDDLLDVSKIEAGMLALEELDFELRPVLHRLRELWSAEARRRGLALALLISDEVPACVTGDPTRLMQILANLVSNALKFTRHGSVRIRVEYCAPRRPGEGGPSETLVRFIVEDTGMGISAAAQRELFAPFVQGDRSISRRFGGSGLGLAICKQLVTMMGGEIALESAPGAGARFSFTLPFLVAHAPTAGWRAPADQGPQAAARYCGSVLVVDDSEVNREVAAAILASWGCAARVAADGETALESIRQFRPDIVLMDCHMPHRDGVAVTCEIRAWESRSGARARIPVIGVSAALLREEQVRCRKAGMDGFLDKPLSLRSVGEMLERWLPAVAHPPRRAVRPVARRSRAPRREGAAQRCVRLFDHAQLQEMRTALGEGFASLAARFEVLAREQIGEMRSAIVRQDAPALRRIAHKLKGASSTLGARRLAAMCARLHRLACSGSFSTAARLAAHLETELVNAGAILRAANAAQNPDGTAG